MAMSVWMIPKMVPVKAAVYVERIRSGQLAYEPQHASDPQKCESLEGKEIGGIRTAQFGVVRGRVGPCACA